MSDDDKKLQENIKLIKQWLARQRFAMGQAYTTALAMLVCAVASAQAHDLPNALAQGGIGTFNCYLGDTARHRYTTVNREFKKIKEGIDEINKLKKRHEESIKVLEEIEKILEKFKQNQQNTK